LDLGIKILTVYAFSTENLNRDPDEVEYLMSMFEENFYKLGDDKRLHDNGIRVTVLGQRDLLPERVQKAIAYAEEKTANYHNYFYNIALAYGSRQEIVQAIRVIAQKVKDGEMKVEDIDEAAFSNFLYTAPFPDPDLILRTSGEERVSNFLLWQIAYSELYFTDVYWPGFRKVDFLRAIRSYQLRQRRFGK
jgi:tritrans,polycis-undecaprenyl-diphosphate synthase [geranylgeranyl-diphosphate specific]